MYEKDPKKRDESALPEPEPVVNSGAGAAAAAACRGTALLMRRLRRHPPPPVPPDAVAQASEKKVIAGVLALILGGLGIHKFYLGYTNEGLIMLLVTVVGGGVGSAVTCGLLAPVVMVMPIFGLIEGIIYLTKSDQEFAATYIVGRKAWF